MKKRLAFRVMIPLLLIFGLTLTVNLTITRKLQSVRESTQQLLESDVQMSSEAQDTLQAHIEDINAGLSVNGVLSSAQLCMVIITIIITVLTVVRPLKKIRLQLDSIVEAMENDEGDLRERIDTRLSDEIGSLVGGMNLMLDKLEGIMCNVKDYSGDLDTSSEDISTTVDGSILTSKEVSEKSFVIREDIQNITDEIRDISGNMEILKDNNNVTSELSLAGREYAEGMRERAQNIETMVHDSRNTSEEITSQLREELEESLENSKSVNNIQALVNDILAITHQTNLLALNASIESARAGEAGRGFAVVADEIRHLSEDSKNTVEKIQEISDVIITSVNSLAQSAEKLLSYISGNVMEDYDKFVNTSKEYLQDADKIQTMMEELNNGACDTMKLSDEINTKLAGISGTADRENQEVTELAEAIQTVAENIHKIQSLARVNADVSDKLKGEMEKFQAI